MPPTVRPEHRLSDEPATSDRFVGGLSESIGGPLGSHAVRTSSRFWTPARVVLLLICAMLSFSWMQKSPCRDGAWADMKQYKYFCYTDVLALYYAEGLNEGQVPYADHQVEYPVLTGAFMGVLGLPVHSLGQQQADRQPGPDVLRPQRRRAQRVRHRRGGRHARRAPTKALGRRDVRRGTRAVRVRDRQLGPLLRRSRRHLDDVLGQTKTTARRSLPRPGDGREVLSGADPRRAAGAVHTHRQVEGSARHVRCRRRHLAGDQRAGRLPLLGLLGQVLGLQLPAWHRLGHPLVHRGALPARLRAVRVPLLPEPRPGPSARHPERAVPRPVPGRPASAS